MKTHSLNTARLQEFLITGPQSLNGNSEIRKILKSESFDLSLSCCSCEAVMCQVCKVHVCLVCQVCLGAPTGQKRLCSLLIYFSFMLFSKFGEEIMHL